MFKTTAFATAAAILVSGAAFAESHVDPAIAGAIKARQSQMTLYAFNLGVLGGMAQDKIPYDAGAASAAAANLVALLSLDQSRYWPEGSDNASVDGTRALPAIWQDEAGVGEKAGALKEAVAAMDAAAGMDLDSLKAAMGPLGGACGGCHKAYRQSE